MKRHMDDLDMRKAFVQEPAACHAALMNAARSVEEGKPVKRVSWKAVLIAAMILIVTMAAGVAASNLLGWSDFFSQYYDTHVPETAQRMMEAEGNQHTYTLGPMRFTTQELFCDGHIALASTAISMADGSDALLCAEPFDPIGAMGENGEQTAQRLGVAPETTWADAAKQLNRPLYLVRAILEIPAELDGGGAMESILWNEDGSAVYFNMPQLHHTATGEKISAQLFLRVAEFDVETGEAKEALTAREPLDLYPEAPIEEYTYEIDDVVVDGYTLREVKAELSGAGLYLFMTFVAPEGTTLDEAHQRGIPECVDMDGNPFPIGISLSSGISSDAESLPEVVYTQMISVDAIPEQMLLRIPDTTADDTGYRQLVLAR